MRQWVSQALMVFDFGILLYFLTINTLYLVFSVMAFFVLIEHRRRWTSRALEIVMRSPATPAISVIAPAYNEEATIEQSLRSLLLLNYPKFEVVVVNDGSKDGTLARLIEAFGLMRAPGSYQQPIDTQPVNALYRSLDHPELVVIDKANGGKADAINAGINAARHPAGVRDRRGLDPRARSADARGAAVRAKPRDAGERRHHPHRQRLQSGSRPGDSHRHAGQLAGAFPGRRVPARVPERTRRAVRGQRAADHLGRVRRVPPRRGDRGRRVPSRHHRRRHGNRRRACTGGGARPGGRTGSCSSPIRCAGPRRRRSRAILASQRNRWQRGTCQVLSYHLAMLLSPTYGSVGMFAMPYFLLFEAAGPLIEAAGYIVTAIAVGFGLIDVVFAQLLFLSAVVFGAMISLTSVLLEEMSFRRYPKVRHLLLLAALGVIENFGYRQLTTWWRLKGVIDFVRKKQGWGVMTRKGFAKT